MEETGRKMKQKHILLLLVASLLSVMAACSAPSRQSNSATPVVSATAGNTASGMFDHNGFDKLLATYVNEQGWVDYAGLQTRRTELGAYLGTLAEANPQEFPNDAERLAFWINAYNAFTLADVLDDVYRKHSSVNEIEAAFFRGKKHRIAGAELTLDEIEKRGRDLHDPRIHFAVVCASTSCPKLQRFAFTAPQLDEQLNQTAHLFLNDPTRGLRVDRDRNQIILSPIFKWYASDFTGGPGLLARAKAELSGSEILAYVKKYAPAEAVQFIIENNPRADYLAYDWSLNSQETHK